MPQSLFLLCLPASAAPPGGDPQTQLESWLKTSLGTSTTAPFELPNFKIGTLDSLIHQGEELAKLDGQFQGMVNKSAEIINTIYEGGEAQVAAAKRIDDQQSPEKYLSSFTWNTNKYRLDKSIADLIDIITKEAYELDADVRSSFNAYSTAKSNLAAVDRKKTGNLSVRSLQDVVRREHFVLDSEHLTTLLIVVPKLQSDSFLDTYETLVPMVVPRSAGVIDDDGEYVLYNVTLFKKYAPEFVAKAREHKWVPREFKYSDTLVSDLRKEQQEVTQAERKQWGEIVRLSHTAYSDLIKAWAHLKAIRTFVEGVLRYGLPPNFVISIFPVPESKGKDKSEKLLIEKFGFLGGAAFAKDTKGKLKGDSDLSEYGALVDTEYKPFVLFDLELN